MFRKQRDWLIITVVTTLITACNMPIFAESEVPSPTGLDYAYIPNPEPSGAEGVRILSGPGVIDVTFKACVETGILDGKCNDETDIPIEGMYFQNTYFMPSQDSSKYYQGGFTDKNGEVELKFGYLNATEYIDKVSVVMPDGKTQMVCRYPFLTLKTRLILPNIE